MTQECYIKPYFYFTYLLLIKLLMIFKATYLTFGGRQTFRLQKGTYRRFKQAFC